MSESGDDKMGVAKPIKPMRIEFETEKQAEEFEKWAYSKETSRSESAIRVREALAAYRKMKKRSR
ncbi:hypothetical protein [Bacillus glycinifermentans]|uniref:hypothetical protein n=1 Tax=Bacillus glycinifermentans TaxID=1664069 RepID=UPI00081BFF10|nr:hypothetical protein [Bacillus glycinifermentans]WKB78831.1 hypothetical protein QYM22_08340 [Bacillus glycinifermentans]